MSYRGLTWDHPRGFNALDAAAKLTSGLAPSLGLTWDKHSLEGFETHPIAELCAQYDLVVLDHPHVGEAVAGDCLVPLEDLFDADEIAGWQRDCIGPSLKSYDFAGRHWALPLDAATQVMATRADRVDVPPTTWDEVLTSSHALVMSLSGPHAVLSFQSICTSLGERPAMVDPDRFISDTVGLEALDLLQNLSDRSPVALREHNPIMILQHMCDHDDIALCPLVYGYVNYATRLAFANAPAGRGGIGSTLGGTGIGISRRCVVTPELLAHLRWLMSDDAQRGFIPAHDGQPSLRTAWYDEGVNHGWGNFYAATTATLEAAYIRPRHDGAIKFQTKASQILRKGLFDKDNHIDILNGMQAAYAQTRLPGTER